MRGILVSAAASTDAMLDVSALPLPQGEWTANIPVVGETFTMLDNHLKWFHDRFLASLMQHPLQDPLQFGADSIMHEVLRLISVLASMLTP